MIETVVAIIRVEQGGVLVTGSHEGLSACAWFDGQRWQRKQFSNLGAIVEPRALFQAADGAIWIGSHQDEFHVQEFRGWVRLTLMPTNARLSFQQLGRVRRIQTRC